MKNMPNLEVLELLNTKHEGFDLAHNGKKIRFRENFTIDLIFNIEKDNVLFNGMVFRKKLIEKYKISEEVARKLYILIDKYQVKTYGHTLYCVVDNDDKNKRRNINNYRKLGNYGKRRVK